MATPFKRSALTLLAATLAAGALFSSGARAEGKISIAQQFGIGYLILDVVRDQQLIEKHGKAQGLEIKVDWNSISGATAMNEALLTGALDVVSAGVPPMLTVWDRTKGKQNVKAIAALGVDAQLPADQQPEHQNPQGLQRQGPYRRACRWRGFPVAHPAD